MTPEALKKKLFDMLEDVTKQLSKYKDLRAQGLSKDEMFEAILNARKQVIADILELVSGK